MDNSPEHLAKLGYIEPLFGEHVFAGLELQYTGERRAPSGETIDDFAVANLTLLAEKLPGGWELSASVFNLFDTGYADPTDDVPALVEQDGRRMGFKATLKF